MCSKHLGYVSLVYVPMAKDPLPADYIIEVNKVLKDTAIKNRMYNELVNSNIQLRKKVHKAQ